MGRGRAPPPKFFFRRVDLFIFFFGRPACELAADFFFFLYVLAIAFPFLCAGLPVAKTMISSPRFFFRFGAEAFFFFLGAVRGRCEEEDIFFFFCGGLNRLGVERARCAFFAAALRFALSAAFWRGVPKYLICFGVIVPFLAGFAIFVSISDHAIAIHLLPARQDRMREEHIHVVRAARSRSDAYFVDDNRIGQQAKREIRS